MLVLVVVGGCGGGGRKVHFLGLATEVNVCLLILKHPAERLRAACRWRLFRTGPVAPWMILMITSSERLQHCGPAVGLSCPRLHLLTLLKHKKGLFAVGRPGQPWW